MSALITVAEDEQRQSLLHHYNDEDEKEEEIAPSSSSSDEREALPPPTPNQRLMSLDVFRGLTIALMILVDDAGGAFPSINHSPWFGVTLADFVMPFFLFGVGVSISLVFKKISSKSVATKKVMLRTIKLFLLGVLLQGGYFHGRNHLTYGIDVLKIRWLGVLQRISIGYLFASISEIWLVNHCIVDSPLAFMKKYYAQWMVSLILCSLYTCLLYFLFVPNWEFEASSINLFGYGSGTQTVICGVRGSLEPPCNAVGLIDRFLLGEHHLYQRPVYRRTKQCSVNSPDYGPLPPNSPPWCLAPFDPEGILSSLMAAVTCLLGLQFGHVLVHLKDHMQRILVWLISSFSLLVTGFVLKLIGIPFSKPLYTLSYTCITTGASGLLLTIIFYAVDVKHFRKAIAILQWMGMNALIIYALAACDLFPAALQGFYWQSPENNLVDGTEFLLRAMLHSEKWGTLAFVIAEILFWGLVAGFLHCKGVYVKL
ncbi:heparan-alpha-glucosaminide N-acetyltransferase isoform X2 [Ricinus communis]|uniref:heparan-alpha-glucosaminide N-acetyltransferase isoform X2 n=1 Tax=Ricinus communis TaxID=3988 RepID=UPI0007726988|nr:heparan-alpha-glucosaminide N-acetyltransferase isoform X2 [Ricinus communis]|eukprot:XP_015572452.1 heparan-alpha-glucosaminide N-acetyltransferase isoform X2 [Ricinus communis]